MTTELCINRGPGISGINYHSFETKLYLSTESNAISSKPPKTKIYCESNIVTAECVHLAF